MEGIVTAIEPQRRRGGRRVNVFVDGRYAFSLQRDVAEVVRIGQPVSELNRADLLVEDEQARAFDAALSFLAARPRSEREIRQRLRRNEVPASVLEGVMERLKGLRLLDDGEFARYWVEQRQAHRPSGARLLVQELHSKGIDRNLVGDVVQRSEEAEEPAEAACRAARKKARSLRSHGEREFHQKLGQFLLRRGFDFEIARTTCRRLWQEREESGGAGQYVSR